MNKDNWGFWAATVAVVGGFLLYEAWSQERPQWEFNEANREKFEKFEKDNNAEAREYRQAAFAADQFRQETGDERWAKVAEKARAKERVVYRDNPYSGKWVKPPERTSLRAIAWLLIVGGIIGFVVWLNR